MIDQFLKAAGINRVVWIDDFFSPPSRNILEDALRRRLFQLKEAEVHTVEIPPFGSIDLSKSRYEIDEQCDEAFAALTEDEIRSFARTLELGDEDIDDLQEDLPREGFNRLRAAFGEGLQTFSLAKWTAGASTEFQSNVGDTLFLIDKQYTREDAGYDGVTLLHDLIQTEAFCILLTHTCNETEQNQERVNIARQSGGKAPLNRFCVLSKQQSGEGDIEQQFARAIYAVMTHRFTGEIAETIRKAIQAAALVTTDKLSIQSVFELDLAFFENSHREGVPEFDVLVRIFKIEQRYAMSACLREVGLQTQLRRARRFRQDTASLRSGWPTIQLNMDDFREWRRREVFEDGLGLNAIHAPLACGDVFEVEAENTKYIFLAQPCDLMIRKDGHRNAEMGLLVLIIESRTSAGTADLSGHRFFDISGVFGAENDWRVDFRNSIVVDISVLDLAVFNSDGTVQLHKNHPEPPILLPHGWLKRLRRAKKSVFESANPPKLAMGSDAKKMECVSGGDSVRYPVRRIGRLDGSTSTAILAAWATFQTRAALEHDFAFKKPESQIPQRAEAAPEANVPTKVEDRSRSEDQG